MQVFHSVRLVADETNLIGAAGLVPAVALAESAGLTGLLERHLSVPSPAAAVKSSCVIAGMLAGADSIDDLDVLRHGAMDKVFSGLRAPSTLGTFLRAFTFGHVRQLDAVNARFLPALVAAVPRLLPPGQEVTFIDIDDTVREVHGYAKQGAAYGYTHLKGLNAQLAAISTPASAPVIAAARLRRGNVASGHGAARLITDAVATTRACQVRGPLLVRADSAYYDAATLAAAARGGWYSITARLDKKVQAAIAAIDEDAWTDIAYSQAITDPHTGETISAAQVAETTYIAFTSKPKRHQQQCRLVVRRVQRLSPTATAGQEELFATYRYHAFVTNSPLPTVQADEVHRDHAIIESLFADLKNGPLAHVPSGVFTANAAWLAFAVTAFNLARALGAAASARHARARWATLQRHLILLPGRVATSARRIRIHLPTHWPWSHAWTTLTQTLGLDPPTPTTT